MDTIVCKNIFLSNSEAEREEAFNEVWQRIVNLIVNK